MLELNSLINSPGFDAKYIYNSNDLQNGELIKQLNNRNVGAKIYNKAVTQAYKFNVCSDMLFSAFIQNTHLSDVSNPISAIFRDLNRFYANGKLDVKDFNNKMSKLEPSNNLIKHLVNHIWQDVDLMVNLTESIDIDKYNPPEIILLSVLKWWPDLAVELVPYTTLYKDAELKPVFINTVSNISRTKNDISVNDVLGL